jgi:transposase-like protein
MKRKRHSDEQIIKKLRQIEEEIGSGKNVEEACKHADISQQTYFRWKRRYGGMKQPDARRLMKLEKENTELKKVVAELTLDNRMLKEVAEGKW